MNKHTIAAKAWLDKRYSRKASGDYLAHQPIYGVSTGCAEPNAVLRFARTYRLLQRLHSIEFESVLDVGGGEGYLAALVRDLFSVSTAHSSDLSAEACRRAGEIFGIQGAAGDATRLPFADNSYDVVICSEVIEHLSRPVAAIAELARIARKYIVITTAEFCPAGELERRLRINQLDSSYPHAEMNWFTAGDFRGLFGDRVALRSQYRNLEHLIPSGEWNRGRVERGLALLTASDTLDVDHVGVIAVCPKGNTPIWHERSHLTAERKQEVLDRLLEPKFASRRIDVDAGELSQSMIDRLHCVRCRGVVKAEAEQGRLICLECRQAYELTGGVPSMFIEAPDDDHIETLDEECVISLGGGSADREQSVRRVIAGLHHGGRQSPVWKQKVASQLLRVLWLSVRDEAIGSKVNRLVGQFTGRPPAGSAEVLTALQPVNPDRTPDDCPVQGERLSGT